MKISISVKPNAKVEKIERLQSVDSDRGTRKLPIPSYKVSVKATPTDGKANDAVVRLIAHHFKVPHSAVRIISGFTSRKKVVEIVNTVI